MKKQFIKPVYIKWDHNNQRKFILEKIKRGSHIMNAPVITDPPQVEIQKTGGVLTHAHSFALRQTILNQLNTSQMAEHESLNKMCKISTNHTKQILQILTDWLCTGHVGSSNDEIEAVNIISELQHAKWQYLVSKENELAMTLKTTTEDFDQAKKEYDELAGVLGIKKPFAKGDDKIKINQAETRFEELKIKKKNLVDLLKTITEEIKNYGDTFIENCCKNLDQIPDSSPLGEKLHKVVQETKENISVEWYRHCQQQQQELKSITKGIECLTNMYAIEEKP